MEVPNIIARQYIELITQFKPSFGNPHHIDISHYTEQIRKKEQLLKRKQSAAKGISKLEAEITKLKSQALHLLKNY